MAGLDWTPDLLLGGSFTVVAWIGLAYAASVAGRRYELKLWPNWPYSAPTNRWLHPDDLYVSTEQKQLYYEAIRTLVGIDIGRAVAEGSDQLEPLINDAVRGVAPQLQSDSNPRSPCNSQRRLWLRPQPGWTRSLLASSQCSFPCRSLEPLHAHQDRVNMGADSFRLSVYRSCRGSLSCRLRASPRKSLCRELLWHVSRHAPKPPNEMN